LRGREDAKQVKLPMKSSTPNISFCSSIDDTRIAVSKIGKGYPIVRAAHWLSHVEFDPISPVWGPWINEISQGNLFVTYDQRGCGLSDRQVDEFKIDLLVADLETVVDTLELETFALLGMSQGGAIAIEYATRHPERVSDLVLLGAYSRGLLKRPASENMKIEAETLLNLIRLGWGQDNPSFRNVFTSQYIPGGTAEQIQWWNDLQQKAASPETAVKILDSLHNLDVTESATKIRTPTTVIHSRGDARIPFEEGRYLASLVPHAEFISLQSDNHVLLKGEPEWEGFMQLLRKSLNAHKPNVGIPPSAELDYLTPSEHQVLNHIARGLTNIEIARSLEKKEKTVRNQVSSILSKLDLSSRSAAIVYARKLGLGTD
jgi:pimeloyl-ACP methyl ester carboxylesterase/DNA-binding CsgD family transcriptional regulator